MIIRKSGYRQTDNVFVAVRFFLKFDSLGRKNRVGNINYNKDETLTLAVDTQFSIQNTQTTDHKGKLYCLEKKVVPTFHFKNHKKKEPNQCNRLYLQTGQNHGLFSSRSSLLENARRQSSRVRDAGIRGSSMETSLTTLRLFS